MGLKRSLKIKRKKDRSLRQERRVMVKRKKVKKRKIKRSPRMEIKIQLRRLILAHLP
jgi:hypothetical protein